MRKLIINASDLRPVYIFNVHVLLCSLPLAKERLERVERPILDRLVRRTGL